MYSDCICNTFLNVYNSVPEFADKMIFLGYLFYISFISQ